ncbi:MAG: DUF2934 domain-containing protein [Nitrospirae bacterium]|nr:DUF2934 domain-containing protein [Nitrospirota bacterium]
MTTKKTIRIRPTRQRPSSATGPDPHIPSVSATLHDRIATRAYEIYERRAHQGPLDDWLQAEREILKQKKIRNANLPHRGGYAGEEQD